MRRIHWFKKNKEEVAPTVRDSEQVELRKQKQMMVEEMVRRLSSDDTTSMRSVEEFLKTQQQSHLQAQQNELSSHIKQLAKSLEPKINQIKRQDSLDPCKKLIHTAQPESNRYQDM